MSRLGIQPSLCFVFVGDLRQVASIPSAWVLHLENGVVVQRQGAGGTELSPFVSDSSPSFFHLPFSVFSDLLMSHSCRENSHDALCPDWGLGGPRRTLALELLAPSGDMGERLEPRNGK